MSYGIYIIHEKQKVGLAKNLDDRLAQQGYTRDEAVIFMEDIEELRVARMIEKQVQEAFGYTAYEQGEDLVDIAIKQQEKMSKDKVFKTFEGNTIGFPMEQESILDTIGRGCVLSTLKGDYTASSVDIHNLFEAGHFRKSKFQNGKLKTYLYTKIVDNYFKDKGNETETAVENTSYPLFDLIREWATDRGIMGPKGRLETQTLKLGEEFGELQKAVLKDDKPEITDAIGDICVVLTSIAYFNGTTIEACIQEAYDVISKRTGKTNAKGDFIKEL